jgi:hypothetical protein
MKPFRCCYQNATACREHHACYLLALILELLRHCSRVLIERERGAVMARECLRDLRVDARGAMNLADVLSCRRGRPSINRIRRFAGVLNLGARAVCMAILRPGLVFARRFTSFENAPLPQFSGTIRPHRFAEMETLCLRHGVG